MLAAGARLGPYEILAPIGAGGMGEVYRARDGKLNREVAIKVLPERLSADAASLSRFEREARAVAALSHPNILAIHDFGTHGAVMYAVMELLEGETLRETLSGGPLPSGRAKEYAREIARGLAAAHEKGIVHRDLKPDNVFVTRDGRVKILDFGLAKPPIEGPAQGETRSPTVSAYTEPGTVMGTVGYMSPEQVRGHPLDHRSDIFSFGTVLCEMLTGRPPFQKETVAETMTAILKEEPSELASPEKGLPAGLERIARHCLEKKPEQRFQSASDIAFALDTLSVSSGAAEVEPGASGSARMRPRLSERVGFAAAGALVAAVAVFLLLTARPRSSAEPPLPAMRFAIAPPNDLSLQGMLALSSDGKRLAFVAGTAFGQGHLFVRPLDSLDARRLEGTEGAAFPFWSPDGRAIAFFAQGKLKTIDPSGGAPRTLCDASAARGGTWNAEGTILFSLNAGGEIDRVAETGGEPVKLAQLVTHGVEFLRFPSFLPDGRHFLYFDISDNAGVRGIHVASIDSPQTSRLVAAYASAAYAPPGYLLYRVGNRLMKQPFDAGRLRMSGEASPVVEDVWWDSLTTLATAFSVSSNGVLAYQTGGISSTRLLWIDRSGRELGSAGPPGAYIEPALSPDGKWVAVTRGEPDSFRVNVWMIDLERGSLSPVSSSDFFTSGPVWNPDGRSIAYANASGGVYVQDAHGGGGPRLLFPTKSFTPLSDWSRDGRLFFYDEVDWSTSHSNLEVRELQPGASKRVSGATWGESGARLSPDGHWLAYASLESGDFEIMVRSFPGGAERRQVSAGGGTQAAWRGDGKELFYVSPDGKIMAADVRTEPGLEVGAPRALFQTRILPLIEARNNYDVTKDGQRFLVNSRRPEDASLPITVIAPWISGARP